MRRRVETGCRLSGRGRRCCRGRARPETAAGRAKRCPPTPRPLKPPSLCLRTVYHYQNQKKTPPKKSLGLPGGPALALALALAHSQPAQTPSPTTARPAPAWQCRGSPAGQREFSDPDKCKHTSASATASIPLFVAGTTLHRL